MSRRQRNKRRHQQRNGGGRRTAFLALGVVLAGIVIGALSVVGYIVGIAASAPNIDSLKPIDKGAASVIYAADGKRLGFISSDTLRTPVQFAVIPTVLRQATVAIEDQRFYKHKGVDYEGIVRAAIKNLEVRQDRPGRLDDHHAARPQPLHLRGADLQAQDPRGQARRGARERALQGAGS